MDAWNHWNNHGKYEKRVIYDLHDKELIEYKEIKKREKEKIKNDKRTIKEKRVGRNFFVVLFCWLLLFLLIC